MDGRDVAGCLSLFDLSKMLSGNAGTGLLFIGLFALVRRRRGLRSTLAHRPGRAAGKSLRHRRFLPDQFRRTDGTLLAEFRRLRHPRRQGSTAI